MLISPGGGGLPPPTMPPSVYVPIGAAVIDIVFAGKDLFPDPSYQNVLPIIEKMRAQEATYDEIAAHLNKLKLKTAKGRPWNKHKVWHVLDWRKHPKYRRPYLDGEQGD